MSRTPGLVTSMKTQIYMLLHSGDRKTKMWDIVWDTRTISLLTYSLILAQSQTPVFRPSNQVKLCQSAPVRHSSASATECQNCHLTVREQPKKRAVIWLIPREVAFGKGCVFIWRSCCPVLEYSGSNTNIMGLFSIVGGINTNSELNKGLFSWCYNNNSAIFCHPQTKLYFNYKQGLGLVYLHQPV